MSVHEMDLGARAAIDSLLNSQLPFEERATNAFKALLSRQLLPGVRISSITVILEVSVQSWQ
jgi:hypothetical protein